MKYRLLVLLILFGLPNCLIAQKTATLIYIDQYKDIAVQEMKRTGIPASITLAQGIVESNSGESSLAKNSNNHFGIKCKLDWKGETTFQDDDTKQECFRVYKDAISSFKDHSDFLKLRPNYAPLFLLDPVDDSAWAYGLKKAGYATASDYPKKLLKVIDDYELSQYNFPELAEEVESFSDSVVLPAPTVAKSLPLTLLKDTAKSIVQQAITLKDSVQYKKDTIAIESATINSSETIAINKINGIETNTTSVTVAPKQLNHLDIVNEPIKLAAPSKPVITLTQQDTIVVHKPIYNYPKEKFRVNQVPAIWATAGTSMLSIASNYHVALYKLFEYNDLKETDLLQNDQLIFVAAKKKEGNKSIHIIKEGENLYEISQSEGIQLQALMTYNNLKQGDTIKVNNTLLLVKPIEQKKVSPIVIESPKLHKDSVHKNDWNFFKKKKN